MRGIPIQIFEYPSSTVSTRRPTGLASALTSHAREQSPVCVRKILEKRCVQSPPDPAHKNETHSTTRRSPNKLSAHLQEVVQIAPANRLKVFWQAVSGAQAAYSRPVTFGRPFVRLGPARGNHFREKQQKKATKKAIEATIHRKHYKRKADYDSFWFRWFL